MKRAFETIYEKGETYRQTGVVLVELTSMKMRQGSLFENQVKLDKIEKLYNTLDELKIRFGRDILVHGAVLNKKEKVKRQQRMKIPFINLKI